MLFAQLDSETGLDLQTNAVPARVPLQVYSSNQFPIASRLEHGFYCHRFCLEQGSKVVSLSGTGSGSQALSDKPRHWIGVVLPPSPGLFDWSTTWNFILCDVKFLVRLQGKLDIDHSWKWKVRGGRRKRSNCAIPAIRQKLLPGVGGTAARAPQTTSRPQDSCPRRAKTSGEPTGPSHQSCSVTVSGHTVWLRSHGQFRRQNINRDGNYTSPNTKGWFTRMTQAQA